MHEGEQGGLAAVLLSGGHAITADTFLNTWAGVIYNMFGGYCYTLGFKSELL